MKKIIYVILFCITSAAAVSSCTEEEVAPRNQVDNAGGQIDETIKKG